ISSGVVRVEVDRPPEHFLRLVITFARRVGEGLAATQDVFVGGEAFGWLAECALPLEAGELYGRRADNASGDVLLHAEDVLDLVLVGLRPNRSSGCGLNELCVDPNAVAGAADTAIEQIVHIEPASDLGRRQFLALELEAGRFGNNEQVRETP